MQGGGEADGRHGQSNQSAKAQIAAPLVARSGLLLYQAAKTATWRSGYATVCKTVYPSSILGVASNPAGTPAPLPKPKIYISGTLIRLGGAVEHERYGDPLWRTVQHEKCMNIAMQHTIAAMR